MTRAGQDPRFRPLSWGTRRRWRAARDNSRLEHSRDVSSSTSSPAGEREEGSGGGDDRWGERGEEEEEGW